MAAKERGIARLPSERAQSNDLSSMYNTGQSHAPARDGPNWDAIRQEYIETDISTRDLAKKHGLNSATVQTRARREGWTKQRKKVECKVNAKRMQKAVNTRAAFIDHLDSVTDGSLTRLEEIIGSCKTPYEIEKAIAALERLYRIKGLDAASQLAFRQAEGTAGAAVPAGDGFIRALQGAGERAWLIHDEPENEGDGQNETGI